MQTGNAIVTDSDTDTSTFNSYRKRETEREAKAKNLLHKLNFILCTFQSWKCAENLQRRMNAMNGGGNGGAAAAANQMTKSTHAHFQT